jgi:hypothetical protein
VRALHEDQRAAHQHARRKNFDPFVALVRTRAAGSARAPLRALLLLPISRDASRLIVLDRLPDNFFGEVEQVACNPANFVPGFGPSPDPMLQARLFGYGDAHRYRLGVNIPGCP